MGEFFTWAILATFAGASAATAVITQTIKRVLSKVPTQLVSYAVAVIILLLATAATGTAEDWTGWAIIPLNAIIVSAAANGAYSAATRCLYGKKDGGEK
ncbi:MAG: hypothetical protein LBC86_03970 [Oscillospiraceae bacterium]|jgi:MFS superfamily sulfate permease-like transporter|nr:hypothetical protein [Oscillospiraceae bacterium]